jgi:hypothetical protein
VIGAPTVASAVRNRFLAWVVTGPIGRLVAFVLDLGAAVIQGAINKVRAR